MSNTTIRALVRGLYAVQKLRIQTGLRVVANFKTKLGQEPGKPETELTPEAKKLLADLRATYYRITDALAGTVTAGKFKGDGIISEYTEYALVESYIALEEQEQRHVRRLADLIEHEPLWVNFLKGVRGVGPAMAGVILSELDIHKAKYPSSFWKYAGLDVVVFDDGHGEGRGRYAEHLTDREYTKSDGTIGVKKSITFNPFLKTKLLGVLASSFLRSGKDSKYASIYYGYKHRLENNPKYADMSKGRRHKMALRYMVKMFLVDLHYNWCLIEGIEPTKPYHEAKLGIKHG